MHIGEATDQTGEELEIIFSYGSDFDTPLVFCVFLHQNLIKKNNQQYIPNQHEKLHPMICV